MNNRVPIRDQKPFAHLQQQQEQKQPEAQNFVVPIKPTKVAKSSLINNKGFVGKVKQAWQSGVLQLIHFDLQEFPDEVINIETINLEGESWWQKCALQKLDLSNNLIQSIPYFETLTHIQVLRMTNNKLIEIPQQLSQQFPQLKSLSLSSNNLTTFQMDSQTLVELNLSDNKIKYFSCNLPALELIDLSNNQLPEFPQIQAFELKKINLGSNQIKVIQCKHIDHLRKLEELSIQKNQLTDLENGLLQNLPKLKLIDLSQNRLRYFTQETLGQNHQQLDQILLSFNQIEIYTAFEGIPTLTVLLVNNNKIKDLEQRIFNLKQLKTLDISNNDLSKLPVELGFLPTLVRIQVEGNPLKTIRQNLRTAGAEELKKYLRTRAEDVTQFEQGQPQPQTHQQMGRYHQK